MDTDDELQRLRSDVRGLARRLARLETALVRAIFVVASAPLILGLVLPYIRYTVDGEERGTALAWMGFQMLSEASGGIDGEEGFFLVALFLPVLVAVTALVSLAMHGRDRAASQRTGFDGLIGVLLGLSTIGVAAVASMAANSTTQVDDPIGPALWFYVPGAIIVATLLVGGSIRRWWDAD